MNTKKLERHSYHILSPGEALESEVLDGIVFCFWDKSKAIGGAAHIDLAVHFNGKSVLIQMLKELKQKGVSREHSEVKIIGAATEKGQDNLLLARQICQHFGLFITGQCIGRKQAQAIRMTTPQGEVFVKPLEKKVIDKPKVIATSSGSSGTKSGNPPSKPSKIPSVLVVDDSPVIRKLLAKMLEDDPDFQAFGFAENAMEAERLMETRVPDIVTLDVQMPGMDGLTYLEKHLSKRKIPVIMISGIDNMDGSLALKAMDLGAVDFIEKPSAMDLSHFSGQFKEKLRAASEVQQRHIAPAVEQKVTKMTRRKVARGRFIVIGSSTGGTVALTNIMKTLPDEVPPILIVQHIPAKFSKLLAERLNQMVQFTVKEACNGDRIEHNTVYIAPGGCQMKVKRLKDKFIIKITDDPPMNKHKPSVDYLFQSVAKEMGSKAVGAILTGMGKDGAKGLLEMKEAGSKTIAQDEDTSVVFGMPQEALKIKATDQAVPLKDVGSVLLKLCG